MRLRRSAALAAAVFVMCAGVAAAPEYATYDVHPAGSDSSQIFGMNTVGEAVGSITRNGVTRAAYWAGPEAAPVELDGLGDTLTRAFDINGAGEIVGIGTTGGAFRAIYWRRFDAAPVQLADLGSGARANAINDRGEVVGVVACGRRLPPCRRPRQPLGRRPRRRGRDQRCGRDRRLVRRRLGGAGLGGSFARPQAVNNASAIGGESAVPAGPAHATFWLTH